MLVLLKTLCISYTLHAVKKIFFELYFLFWFDIEPACAKRKKNCKNTRLQDIRSY